MLAPPTFRLLTLTTDFGTADGYVGALKGVIYSVAPAATLVDLSHEVPAQDVMAAAFVLQQAAAHFPSGTVHLAVVDPGVGTRRRAVAARFTLGGRAFTFVGPDNGLLPLVLDGGEPERAVVLDRPEVWRTAHPSATFHGRDVFGPVAARLAAGATLGEVGSPAGPLHRLHWPLPRTDRDGIDGMVIAVDRYGNCITNVTRESVEAFGAGRAVTCYVGTQILRGLQPTYGAVAPGEAVALFGSDGRLEIAVHNGDAATLFSVRRGDKVNLVFDGAYRAHADALAATA